MILIISFIPTFKINKVNPFPALTTSFPLLFLSNLFISFEAKLLTIPSKLSQAKGTTRYVITFLPKLSKILRRNPSDLIILDI